MIENARVYAKPGAAPVSMVVLRDGRVVALGDAARKLIGTSTKRIDAAGRAVLPGLIDSHVHMRGLGDMLESFDFRHVRTVQEVASAVAKRGAALPKGQWIRGRNWDQTNWGGALPTAEILTAAAPDHPVFLSRVDGHAAWVNRRALDVAGITAATADPHGGKIIRDSRGEPTGVLIDRAQALVSRHIPAPSDDEVRARLRRAARECARLGLTSVHDAGIGAAELRAYRALIAAGELPVRVYAMIGGEGDLWREYLTRGIEVSPQLTVRSIKLVADGAMGSGGAAFWQPYSDEKSNSGLLILDRAAVERVARAAVAKGFQVNTHAIGDRANRTVLEAYAAVLGGGNGKRFRIEHAQVVSLPDFDLFRANSIVASMQATHATSDMRWAERRLGPDRVSGAYAWRRMLKYGIPLANGSDFPVEDPNPLWGFHAAITRQDHTGQPAGGWRPDERLSRAEALHSWTVGGAYAAFEEQEKGTLEPGRLADLIVLSKDILAVPEREILEARVLMTVLGGRVVYRDPKF